jgi:thiol-disulfide isomerase/thioredoxin
MPFTKLIQRLSILILSPVMLSTTELRPIGDIIPLEIGDSVPDIRIKNIINHTESSVHLSDFRDKMILLDFWGTSCTSCIAALPGLDSLQKKFKDRLQVITVTKLDSKDKVESTLRHIRKTNNLQLPIVIADEILYKYFPYKLVSHAVWIDKDRKLRAVTGIEYVTKENIEAMLSGKEANMPVKKDAQDYNYDKPLLDLTQKDIAKPDFLYYSAFTSYLDGISPPNGRKVDSANKTITISFYNMGLLALSKIALDYKTAANLKEFVLEVKDSSRFIMNAGEYSSEWNKKNKFCYTVTLPIHISEQEAEQIVRKDIIHWLSVIGYTVKKEKRSIDCLALFRSGNHDLLYTKRDKYLNDLDDPDSRKLTNGPFSTFVGFLNKRLSYTLSVVNETGISDNTMVDIELRSNSLEDMQTLYQDLKKYGLAIKPIKKDKEMYIIIETGSGTETSSPSSSYRGF